MLFPACLLHLVTVCENKVVQFFHQDLGITRIDVEFEFMALVDVCVVMGIRLFPVATKNTTPSLNVFKRSEELAEIHSYYKVR